MTSFRKLLLVTASALALCGVQACASESDLNPQPLPPEDSENGKGGTTGGGSSGSSGANAPPDAADAGPDAAIDGGDQ